MRTQLIMTVGTNALPIWVAWQHLKREINDPIGLRFIHTEQTENEKDLLEEKITTESPETIILPAVPIDSGNLQGIHEAIRENVVRTRPDNCTCFHIHYTGGTKSMGVETTSIIERTLSGVPDTAVNTSYLNPRGSHGPKIVSRTHLHVPDTREGINIDLESITELNSVQLIKPPAQPTTAQINRGIQWLNNAWPHPPDYRVRGENPNFILEYGVYAAFDQALTHRNREHWQLYRGLRGSRVARPGRGGNPNPFELDVVAVLGYQVVLVSCSIENNASGIKLKAMEGIIRARQLGGDAAQCITVCIAENGSCANIQSGLEDEMGDDNPHIRIWGKSNANRLPDLQGLTSKFREYLNDLEW